MSKRVKAKVFGPKDKVLYRGEEPTVEEIVDIAIKRMAEEQGKQDRHINPELIPGLHVRRWNESPSGVLRYQVVRVSICDDGHGPKVSVANVYNVSHILVAGNYEMGSNGCSAVCSSDLLSQYEIETSSFQRIEE
jgi:hypothetical protein